MHGYGGRKRSVPILGFVALGYGYTAMVCFLLLAWLQTESVAQGCFKLSSRGGSQHLLHDRDHATVFRLFYPQRECLDFVLFCFLFLYIYWYLSLMLLLCSCVCRLMFVRFILSVGILFVCAFSNMFLELVNTVYCLAVGTLPLLLSSTYLFLFVTSSLSPKFLYPIHCRLFLSRENKNGES